MKKEPEKNNPAGGKDDLTVTILGSGTCVPSPSRGSCALLMETDDKKLLFDCGPGTMGRLTAAGIAVYDIHTIFLSHFHPDHCGELVSFLFSTRYAGTGARKLPLNICGGRGLADFYAKLQAAFGPWMAPSEYPLTVRELDISAEGNLKVDGISITSMPMAHKPESLGYRVESPGGTSAVYSGDTDFTENLITLASKTDLLICESSHPDALKAPGHLTPSLAGSIAEKASARHLVLTHFYPAVEQVDIAKECRKEYKGRLTLAEDLLVLKPGEAPHGQGPGK